MSIQDIYKPYFQAIADVLFPATGGKKNLVEVGDVSDASEVQLFQSATGFTSKFIILEWPDNSFEKTTSQAFTDVSGSFFVMGAVDKVKSGLAGTETMKTECEALCKRIFETMVFDSEPADGRALYASGIEVESKAPGNWATMLNKFWGYRIEFKWTLQEDLYYSSEPINHNFTI